MPTPLFTDARNALATNLLGAGYRVHSFTPNVPTPPCYVIKPGTPWIIPRRLGSNVNAELRLDVLIVADGRTNDVALKKCETMIESLIKNVGDGFTVEQAGPPLLTDLGGKGSALTVETTITAQIKE
jgi:hypothetical protein